jgi:hypothetical protein
MKKITLTNPEEAQFLFHGNEWLYRQSYFISAITNNNEICIVSASEINTKTEADAIKVKLGDYLYEIELDEFEQEISISFRDVSNIGALFEINEKPYLLRAYNNATEASINSIGELLPDLRIIDFGTSKNKALTTLNSIASCSFLTEINVANCKQLTDISSVVNFKELKKLNIDGFTNEEQLKLVETLSNLTFLSNKKNKHIEFCNAEYASELFKVFAAHDDDYSFYIKAIDFNDAETTILDLSEYSEETVGTHILVKLGFELEYKFDLANYDDSIKIELKNYNDSGIILEINNTPVLLHLINKTEESSGILNSSVTAKDDQWISVLFEEIKNIKTLEVLSMPSWDYGTIPNTNFLSDSEALETINISNCTIQDITGLLSCKNLKRLIYDGAQDATQLEEILQHTNLEYLSIKSSPLKNLDAISNQVNLTYLYACNSDDLLDTNGIKPLKKLKILDLSFTPIEDLSFLLELEKIDDLNIAYCKGIKSIDDVASSKTIRILTAIGLINLVSVKKLHQCPKLFLLNLVSSPNIRDLESLKELPSLQNLYHDDEILGHFVVMLCGFKNKNYWNINRKLNTWTEAISLCKNPKEYMSAMLNCMLYTTKLKRPKFLSNITDNMRSRGLQSEFKNDLDAYTWETWCNLALELEKDDALSSLFAAVNELDVVRESEVILGPVIVATSKMIEKYPEEKENLLNWVNEQLQLLEEQSEEQRQIAPSAAVFFASLNRKDDVLFWLQKATDEKAPLWRERVLKALVKHYAEHENFSEARRLLDEMDIQDEKDLAIASLAKAMAAKYPVEAGFLIHDIHEAGVSAEAARNLLSQPAMLHEPQGIYQLLLHLQSNPDELAETLEKLIELDTEGKITDSVKQLFLQPQATGPSASVLLELCKHPAIADFVKPRALEKYKNQLQERANQELSLSIPQLIAEMQEAELLEEDEAFELKQIMQTK